ncbi:MAG: hypothetical protein GC162_08375 [Planctomycetes bacterium]|nr:hypothetical protein [Planctomycetota bacterium]
MSDKTGWVILMMLLAGPAVGRAAYVARVSEVLTRADAGPGGTYPAYVEIFAPLAPAGSKFDFVVLNASTNGNWLVMSVTTLTARAGADTYIVHEGTWPVASPPSDVRFSPLSGSLFLSATFSAARALVIYDHSTGLVAGNAGAVVLAVTGVLDAVTYVTKGTPQITPRAFAGETPMTITTGQALVRMIDGSNYTDQFAILNAADAFAEGTGLNPGFVNEASGGMTTSVPEPVSALGWSVLAAGLTGRRSKRASSAIRRNARV